MASLKENAYDLNKERILNGTYVSNDIIDEKDLAAELRTSRTPVREALIALAQEGFIEILPKRGVFVAPFSYNDILAVFQIRELLEPWLIKTYGPLLTEEELRLERKLTIQEIERNREQRKALPGISIKHHPHRLLMEKCENKYIRNMLDLMEAQLSRVPSGARKNLPPVDDSDAFFNMLIDNHMLLLDLMERKDFDAAAQEMIDHVQKGRKSYMEYWFGQV